MESTRSIGYSFESAVADLIDNSISAGSSVIEIQSPPSTNPYVMIIDNGNGMNEDELLFAMRYGCIGPSENRHEKDLGRFGLGLKMASLSQCRCLTVLSKKDHTINAYRWDLDHVVKKNEWVVLKLTKDDIEKLPNSDMFDVSETGTIVYWHNLDRVIEKYPSAEEALTDKLAITKEHLALTFHRFLNGEIWEQRLRIIFNGDEINPSDPFLTKHQFTRPHPEQIFSLDGHQIRIKPYTLPPINKIRPEDSRLMGGKINMKRMQGFYVYRNGRLIVPGNWFKLSGNTSLQDLARVRIDIPTELDSLWEIDIKKSSATLPDSIKRNIIQFLDQVTEASVKVYRYKGRKIQKDNIYIWEKIEKRDLFKYSVNRNHPLFVSLVESLPVEKAVQLENFICLVENYLPILSINADLKSDEMRPFDANVDDEEADSIVKLAKELVEQRLIDLDSLLKTEPFSYHSKKILEEVGGIGEKNIF